MSWLGEGEERKWWSAERDWRPPGFPTEGSRIIAKNKNEDQVQTRVTQQNKIWENKKTAPDQPRQDQLPINRDYCDHFKGLFWIHLKEYSGSVWIQPILILLCFVNELVSYQKRQYGSAITLCWVTQISINQFDTCLFGFWKPSWLVDLSVRTICLQLIQDSKICDFYPCA